MPYHTHDNKKLTSFLIKEKFFLVSLFFPFIACNEPHSPVAAQPQTDTAKQVIQKIAGELAGNFSNETTLKFDSGQVSFFFSNYSSLLPFKENVKSFYKNRNFSYAWYDANGQIEQAGNFYSRFANLKEEGLAGTVPYLERLDSLMGNAEAINSKQQTETELLLTGLYFCFAQKVWGGLNEKQTTKAEWYLPRKKISYEKYLDSLLTTGDSFISTNEPVYRQYSLLKSFLKKYQDIKKSQQWEVIKAGEKSYRLGDSSSVIRQIKRKLFLTNDLSNDTANPVFNAALQAAVKKFQHRYGAKEDGIIGQGMLSELNVPLENKIQKIIVNMERSRWLPMNVKGEYLAVNIPEFKLHVYKEDSLLWDMNVVVGKSVHKTVIFSGHLNNVVFSPYWNVPPGILNNEILPGIRKNKNYLAVHHMERYSSGVRQLPGPWNSLGQVKFLFPNSYSIYLHDTPSKNLFNEDKRAFSHGCIRVAEPKKLAAYLLRKDPYWNDEKITAAMKSGKEKYVTLNNKIPVFITYFTAFVDRQGNINFRDDIYNRDNRLRAMLVTDK